jgi:hypothetical protein
MPTNRTRSRRGRLRMPSAWASKELKQRYIDQENDRLKSENSKWRYGFSSADPDCICLLGVEK